MSLVLTVNQFIKQHQLEGRRFVVGLSGGVDSVVLLDALVKSQLPTAQIIAVHVNHGLSANAGQWQVFCQQLCAEQSIDYQCEQVNVLSSKLGIEGEARLQRYQAFDRHLSADTVLVTAQHLNDQAETLLLALKRGSGVLGLAAMAPCNELKNGLHARPLLSITRHEIEQWATTHNLSWIEDESNQDQSFDRNYLRHHVINDLNVRWPSFSQNVARTAALCQEAVSLADEVAKEDFSHQASSTQQLELTALKTLSQARQNNLLRYWLRLNRVLLPSSKQLAEIIQQANSADYSKMKIVLGDKSIRRFQQRLYVVDELVDALSQQTIVEDISKKLTFDFSLGMVKFNEAISNNSFVIKKPNNESTVTIEFGLSGSIKAWPSSRDKRRTLKKLWQEFKVPPWERPLVPCLCVDGELVAVIGYWVETEWLGEQVGENTAAQILTLDWHKH